MDFIVNFVIITLFIFPVIALIHELGHAFFLKLFGGAVKEFAIGNGNVLWKKNVFFIKTAYFAGGRVVPENIEILSKNKKMFFYLGGVLFNLLSALTLHFLTGYEFFVFRNYLDSFIFVSYLNVIINLIPLVTVIGPTDGKQIIDLSRKVIN
ncbi:site-2 protease family protein [Psychrobacillus sp. FSL K6-4046]|uniref:site-2 protease family protein n=1 Tax=unclassified Psychrobacillus TaxID=2636677 RepID=UPI00203BAF61|nr:site-2 protease family protein [Psychrobacillus sp. MER TA 171]MCM3356594.1 site-2 protease family protein [Psychrobacillus sp. MER TA 171]